MSCSSATAASTAIPDDFCGVDHLLEWAKAGVAGNEDSANAAN